jgi:hypothetical protein
MSKLQYVGTYEVPLENISWSEFSANEMDDSQRQRLSSELEGIGLPVTLPSLLKKEDGYEVLGGRHRITEWGNLGHDSIVCNVFAGNLSKEEKFNLVNNLNTVHGKTSKKKLKQIIDAQELTLAKLDIFRHPTVEIMKMMQEQRVEQGRESMKLKADVLKIAQRVSKKVAEVIAKNEEAAVVCFVIDGQPVSVVKIDANVKTLKSNVRMLQMAMEESLSDWLEHGESVSFEENEI